MTALHVIRRTHLYLGLTLLPWIAMYGISSLPFNHGSGPPMTWTRVARHQFDRPIPGSPGEFRAFGRQLLATAGFDGGFYASRQGPTQFTVNRASFLRPIRLTYHVDQREIVVESRSVTGRSLLTSLHGHGGFGLDGAGNMLWAVLVDLASLGLLIWIATGLVMWWVLPVSGPRRWGWIALAGGLVSFTAIVMSL